MDSYSYFNCTPQISTPLAIDNSSSFYLNNTSSFSNNLYHSSYTNNTNCKSKNRKLNNNTITPSSLQFLYSNHSSLESQYSAELYNFLSCYYPDLIMNSEKNINTDKNEGNNPQTFVNNSDINMNPNNTSPSATPATKVSNITDSTPASLTQTAINPLESIASTTVNSTVYSENEDDEEEDVQDNGSVSTNSTSNSDVLTNPSSTSGNTTSNITSSTPITNTNRKFSTTSSIESPDIIARKVFIGGLSWDTTEENLYNFFVKYGPIEEYEIMRDKVSNGSRGFGFILYRNLNDAEIVRKLENLILDGRSIEIKMAISKEEMNQPGFQKTKKLFIGGINNNTSENNLTEYFSKFGLVRESIIQKSENGNSRGFGFVIFHNEESVEKAITYQESGEKLFMKGQPIDIKRAIPKMPQWKHLRIKEEKERLHQRKFNTIGSIYSNDTNNINPTITNTTTTNNNNNINNNQFFTRNRSNSSFNWRERNIHSNTRIGMNNKSNTNNNNNNSGINFDGRNNHQQQVQNLTNQLAMQHAILTAAATVSYNDLLMNNNLPYNPLDYGHSTNPLHTVPVPSNLAELALLHNMQQNMNINPFYDYTTSNAIIIPNLIDSSNNYPTPHSHHSPYSIRYLNENYGQQHTPNINISTSTHHNPIYNTHINTPTTTTTTTTPNSGISTNTSIATTTVESVVQVISPSTSETNASSTNTSSNQSSPNISDIAPSTSVLIPPRLSTSTSPNNSSKTVKTVNRQLDFSESVNKQ